MSRNSKRRRDISKQQSSSSKAAGSPIAPNSNKNVNKKNRTEKQELVVDASSLPAVATYVVDYDKSSSTTGAVVPPISVHASLKDLIHPLSVQNFIDDYFQPLQKTNEHTQRPPKHTAVHFTCPAGQEARHAQRVKDLVDNEMLGLDPKLLLQETSSDSVFIWLRPQTSNHPSQQQQQQLPLVQSMEATDASNALALLQCGHATYCRAPPAVEQPLVASLLRDTGLGCGQYDPSGNSTRCLGRGEVEVFITSSSNTTNNNSNLHATDWHFDFQENFTIQLSGTKRWTLQSGTTPFPLRGCTPHYASPSSVEGQLQAAHLIDRKFQFGYPQENINAVGKPQTILVQPGDVLYFPAGMWHKVECIEPGVSINVSLMATTYANVVGQALQHLLLQRDEWRRTVACHPSNPNGVLEHVQQLLQDLPNLIQSYSEQNDLARCILPPVLQLPTRFLATEGESDNEDEGDDDDDEADDDDEEDIIQMDEQDEDAKSEPVVVVTDFRPPEDWKNLKKSDGGVLMKNPLARLTRMDEITGYYSQRQKENSEKADTSLLYVLHVNYAGNEMLESAVRVVFRDDPKSKCLKQLYEALEIGQDSSLPVSSRLDDTKLISNGLIDCMLYHGYLQWGPEAAKSTTTSATRK